MDTQQQILELQNEINQLRGLIDNLNGEVFRGNFSAHQDFSKYSNFSTSLKVPSYSTAPSTCEIGEIIEVAGKLCICSTTNNFTIVGTQS